jgi:hypothetical protein
VRALARSAPRAAVVVVNAGRDFVEEVVWALADAERARVWFDFSWLWGPPDDHLARLLAHDRARSGSCTAPGGRCASRRTPRALLDLLPADVADPPLAHAGALVARARGG